MENLSEFGWYKHRGTPTSYSKTINKGCIEELTLLVNKDSYLTVEDIIKTNYICKLCWSSIVGYPHYITVNVDSDINYVLNLEKALTKKQNG